MKKYVFFSMLFLFVPFFVQADVVSQIGADFQYRYMSVQKGMGDNFIKNKYPQGSVYGGLKLNDWFGVELGYQTAQAKRQVTIKNGDGFFSQVAQTAGGIWSANTHSSVRGAYGSLVGFLPISEEYRLNLMASIGFARLKARVVSKLTNLDTGNSLTTVAFSSTKWIPKANMGVQHMIQDDFGVRALVGWEQTSKFSRMPAELSSGNANSYFASLKNSTTLGLGMFYNF